ncbi:MAG: polyprenyl synthetase family protein [Bacteroidales bacterium]|nr:polyprenyl synthetase family protein [Bacteroidales bacterium]
MRKYLQLFNEYLASVPLAEQEPKNLYEPVSYVLSFGGKRIRPVLAMIACEMFGGKAEDVLPQATGIEIFHNFTLLHDDVMDNADMRRGNDTVHKKWNTNTAILSGDAMLILAYRYIAVGQKEKLPALLESFNRTALGVCEGQQYDMDFEKQQTVTLREYLEMIRLKTAVLIAGALDIGAIMGGASPEAREHLQEYGTNIGLAFQLQDDLLDLYGDEKTFGKKIGSDIIEKKKTFLWIKAQELLTPEGRISLRNAIDTADIAGVRKVYDSINIKEHCQEEIQKYYEKSLSTLKQLPNSTALENFSKELTLRIA